MRAGLLHLQRVPAISLERAFFDSSACRRSHPKSRRTECRFRYNRRCKQKSYRNRHRKSSGSGCELPCAVPAPDDVPLTTDSVVLPNQDRWTRPATLVHGSHTANRSRTVCGKIIFCSFQKPERTSVLFAFQTPLPLLVAFVGQPRSLVRDFHLL
jgi:hypothetical protein